jgi:hypothetical protein
VGDALGLGHSTAVSVGDEGDGGRSCC